MNGKLTNLVFFVAFCLTTIAQCEPIPARPEGTVSFSKATRSELTDRRFEALYFGDSSTMIGEFTIDGPIASTLRPISGQITKIAVDREYGRVFGRGHHDVYFMRYNKKPRLIKQDSKLEEMSWLSAITWDAKNERLLASTFAGGGCLYAYEPDKKKRRWSIVCRPGLAVSAFVHAETEDKLYGVNLNTGDEPITTLYEFNSWGARIAQRKLSQPIPTDQGYGPTQLVWLDGWLYLIQSQPSPSRGYLIDPSTGVIHKTKVLSPTDSIPSASDDEPAPIDLAPHFLNGRTTGADTK